MAKIRHGKYIYNAEQATKQMDGYAKQIKELYNIQTFVQEWVDAQLDNHQPYFNGPLDLSGAEDSAEVHTQFVEKLTRDLWCASCGNSWPCKRLGELRVLRDSLFHGEDLTAEYVALRNFRKAENKNTIPVQL